MEVERRQEMIVVWKQQSAVRQWNKLFSDTLGEGDLTTWHQLKVIASDTRLQCALNSALDQRAQLFGRQDDAPSFFLPPRQKKMKRSFPTPLSLQQQGRTPTENTKGVRLSSVLQNSVFSMLQGYTDSGKCEFLSFLSAERSVLVHHTYATHTGAPIQASRAWLCTHEVS